MTPKTITTALILIVTALVLVYDGVMIFFHPEATITAVTRAAAHDHPIIGVLVGILVGHLFFCS
jgi:uncharacterized protein YjeT (DUF2065 family)